MYANYNKTGQIARIMLERKTHQRMVSKNDQYVHVAREYVHVTTAHVSL